MNATVALPGITPPIPTATLGTPPSSLLTVPTFETTPKRTTDHLALSIATRTAAVGISSFASYHVAKQAFPGQGDKAKHAFVSAAISSTVSAATEKPLLGLAASVAVGITKELIDGSRLNPNGSRDFRLKGDLGADLMGAVLGSLAISVTIPLEKRLTRKHSH